MPKVGVEFLAECIKAEAVVVTQQQSRPRIPKRCVFYQFGICAPNTLVSMSRAEIDDSQVNGILMSKVRYNKTAELLGPKAALKHAGLDGLTENDRLQWLEDARVHAILDCSLLSRDSLRSGFRCYRAFANQADPSRGSCLPPRLDIILAWSTTFRSKGTFSNYVAYVRTVCLLCKVSVKACVNLGQ